MLIDVPVEELGAYHCSMCCFPLLKRTLPAAAEEATEFQAWQQHSNYIICFVNRVNKGLTQVNRHRINRHRSTQLLGLTSKTAGHLWLQHCHFPAFHCKSHGSCSSGERADVKKIVVLASSGTQTYSYNIIMLIQRKVSMQLGLLYITKPRNHDSKHSLMLLGKCFTWTSDPSCYSSMLLALWCVENLPTSKW